MAHLSFSPGKLPPSDSRSVDERCLSVSPHFGIFWPHRSTAQPGRPSSLLIRAGGRARDFALQRDDVKISSVSVSKRKQLPSPAPPTRQTYFAVVARMDPRQRGSGMPTTISTPPLARGARLCCAGQGEFPVPVQEGSRWGVLFRVQCKPVTHIRFKTSVLLVPCTHVRDFTHFHYW